jgi:hypothetical protein
MFKRTSYGHLLVEQILSFGNGDGPRVVCDRLVHRHGPDEDNSVPETLAVVVLVRVDLVPHDKPFRSVPIIGTLAILRVLHCKDHGIGRVEIVDIAGRFHGLLEHSMQQTVDFAFALELKAAGDLLRYDGAGHGGLCDRANASVSCTLVSPPLKYSIHSTRVACT